MQQKFDPKSNQVTNLNDPVGPGHDDTDRDRHGFLSKSISNSTAIFSRDASEERSSKRPPTGRALLVYPSARGPALGGR